MVSNWAMADVRVAFRDERQYLALAGRQPGERVAMAAQEQAYHLRGDHGPSGGHLPQCGDELRHVYHPILEQVAHATPAAGVEQLGGILVLDVLAEYDDGQAGVAAPRFDCGAQPLILVIRRHPDIGHHEVRCVLGDGPAERIGVADRGDDIEAESRQQAGRPFPEQDPVLSQD
ncbi:hypothetical protein GCM10023259_049600 [Thermocatellispora tengchongensis]